MKTLVKIFLLVAVVAPTLVDAYEVICPKGFSPFGKSCRADSEVCSIKGHVKASAYTAHGMPTTSCARGRYENGRCYWEDYYRPEVLCPPGWDLRYAAVDILAP